MEYSNSRHQPASSLRHYDSSTGAAAGAWLSPQSSPMGGRALALTHQRTMDSIAEEESTVHTAPALIAGRRAAEWNQHLTKHLSSPWMAGNKWVNGPYGRSAAAPAAQVAVLGDTPSSIASSAISLREYEEGREQDDDGEEEKKEDRDSEYGPCNINNSKAAVSPIEVQRCSHSRYLSDGNPDEEMEGQQYNTNNDDVTNAHTWTAGATRVTPLNTTLQGNYATGDYPRTAYDSPRDMIRRRFADRLIDAYHRASIGDFDSKRLEEGLQFPQQHHPAAIQQDGVEQSGSRTGARSSGLEGTPMDNGEGGRIKILQHLRSHMTEQETVLRLLNPASLLFSPLNSGAANNKMDGSEEEGSPTTTPTSAKPKMMGLGLSITDSPKQLYLDEAALRRQLMNERRPTVFQHIARFHNRFGIRHYVLVLLLALYALGGGMMFQTLEADNELINLQWNRDMLQEMLYKQSKDIIALVNVSGVAPLKLQEEIVFLIRDYYQEMLKIEGKYVGSVFHKYEQINIRLTWYYGNAVFYAMTLFTTIGYGTIACQTTAGKVASVIYATIGIPLMLVVLSDLGVVLLRSFTRAYNFCLHAWNHLLLALTCRFRAASESYYDPERDEPNRSISTSYLSSLTKGRKFAKESSDESTSDSDEESEDDEEEFPLFLSVPIVVAYLLLVSFIVSFFDYHDGVTQGLSFGDSFYYSFISLSTVGLGDVMPNNIEYSPILALFFLFGLALLSVVNSTLYQRLESKFLAGVDSLEEYLETVHYYRHGREGYWVLKHLAPNIQLLVVALPIYDELPKDELLDDYGLYHEFHDRRRRKPRATSMMAMVETRPRRVRRDSSSQFRPTLGIWRSFTPSPTSPSGIKRRFSHFHPLPSPPHQARDWREGERTTATAACRSRPRAQTVTAALPTTTNTREATASEQLSRKRNQFRWRQYSTVSAIQRSRGCSVWSVESEIKGDKERHGI